jgi:hypothetical protein
MSTPEQRMRMAKKVVDFGASRDKKGHLRVYKLPPRDGGGRYEVAGINERFNKAVADRLVDLIETGDYIAGIFDHVTTTSVSEATNSESDGIVGRQTMLKALSHGFELMDEPSSGDKTGSNFSAKTIVAAPRLEHAASGPFRRLRLCFRPAAPQTQSTFASSEAGSRTTSSMFRSRSSTRQPFDPRLRRRHASIGSPPRAQLQGLWKDWEDAKLLDGSYPLPAPSSPASCAAAGLRSAITPSVRLSTSMRNGTQEAIARRLSTRKVRRASSFPSPMIGASGGAAIFRRRTACISRLPC